ncbi:RluA family pseudouridine synthase [Opitutus sp. ER46]|uniref:RluA family pseudouridine synthase n=1 Tax=Opitutus sp. ER46 TaxID=2161864 RepID=UPI000D2F9E20|nr:RluA family pseudouridine synthase [Opitutus sp. ER46]PTX98911.1 RluA family pseudouridine synthase [Opitutus sp. ER46]
MAAETYTVPEGSARARADKALAQGFPGHSRTALQRAFDAGLVRLRGEPIKRDHAVVSGDVLEFALPEVVPTELKPVDIPLDVIFEDRHMLAINKASGMVVHPGAATGEDTLVHALLAHCAGSLSGIGGVERPGIVHRLDKETTGVIVVAKTDAAHRALADQFATRALKKEYVALVAGAPDRLSGMIDRAISRHPVHRHRMTVGEGGKPARTAWERAEAFGQMAALIRCQIFTGRTHQIRVHLKSIGFPILGDALYGWKPDPRMPLQPDRVMLHAEHLVLTHPMTGKELDLRAPLPKDFTRLIKALRKATAK